MRTLSYASPVSTSSAPSEDVKPSTQPRFGWVEKSIVHARFASGSANVSVTSASPVASTGRT